MQTFFSKNGAGWMKLSKSAAQEVFRLLHSQGLLVSMIEAGIWHNPGFEPRLDGMISEDSIERSGVSMDDVRRHLEADPRLDSARIGVTGGSYGGYMCYASVIAYGALLRVANCIVAISDFVTFLENTQDYRRHLRRVEYGDERDPAQRAKLKQISPLTRADEIRIPLMVATGANDPRMPASEADQIIAAVRDNGGEAWHFLAQNEDHGFAKKENADYFLWFSIMFWQRHLLNEE